MFKDGDISLGFWENGKLNKEGILLQKEITYIGTFKEDLLNGICLIDSKEKGLSISNFIKGHKIGYGIMDYLNGDRYEGEWNGKYYQGKGTYFEKDGEIIFAYYENSIVKETYISCFKKHAILY